MALCCWTSSKISEAVERHQPEIAPFVAAEIRPLVAVAQAAQEVIDQDVKVSRPDGGENRLGISLANLKRALEAL